MSVDITFSRTFWRPTIGEQLVCKREVSNAQDTYAVAVICGGHSGRPCTKKNFSSLFTIFGKKEKHLIGAPSVAVAMCAHTLGQVHHALRDSWILLVNSKFGRRLFNRQITKLKPPPKFPVIQYLPWCFFFYFPLLYSYAGLLPLWAMGPLTCRHKGGILLKSIINHVSMHSIDTVHWDTQLTTPTLYVGGF